MSRRVKFSGRSSRFFETSEIPGSTANRIHRSLGLNEAGGIDLVPFFLRGDALLDRGRDLIVACPATKQFANVRLFETEQAISELTIRRDTNSVATEAERLAD